MNKSLNKIVESIMIDLKQVTDESYLFGKEAFLKDKIDGWRASMIRDSLENKVHTDPLYYQRFDKDISSMTAIEPSGSISFESTTTLLKAEIPSLIPGIGLKAIRYVGNDDYRTAGITIMSLSGFQSSEARQYTGKLPAATIVGNDIFFRNLPSGMKKVYFIALLNSPSSIIDDDDGYPVPSTSKLELLVKQDLMKSWGLPLDVIATSNDESIPNAPQHGPQKVAKNE